MLTNLHNILKSTHGVSLTLTFFTLPMIMLIIGLKGETSLAAEISIIHSLIFLIFFPLSGNARNYLLNSKDQFLKSAITNFRIILYVPLLIITFLINEITLKIELGKFSCLILIGSFFWIYEIFVTDLESKGKNFICFSFLLVISILISSFFFQEIFSYNDIIKKLIYLLILYFPITLVFVLSYNKKINFRKLKLVFLKKISHHIGSSFVVGGTSFLIKILIMTIFQKQDAGNIFLGFTIGGALVTFFSYGIGPTILKNLKDKKLKLIHCFKIIIITSFFFILIFIFNETFNLLRIKSLNSLFYYSLYFSLIGSTFMIFGQYFKLFIMQQNAKFNIMKFELIIGFSSISFVLLLFVSQNKFLITSTFILSSIITFFVYNEVYKKIYK